MTKHNHKYARYSVKFRFQDVLKSRPFCFYKNSKVVERTFLVVL